MLPLSCADDRWVRIVNDHMMALRAWTMPDRVIAELTERRQALAIAMADEWARAKGYKMTVTQSLDAAAGE